MKIEQGINFYPYFSQISIPSPPDEGFRRQKANLLDARK
jgi:hypothetical protein